MDISTDFTAFQKAITDALVASTRTAGQIASEDLSFHRSSNSSFSSSLDAQNVRLLQLTSRLLKAAASGSNDQVSAPQLEDIDSVEDNWRGIVDVVDDLLEKADRCLDEFTGVIKRLSPKRDLGDGTTLEKKSNIAPKPNRFFSKVMKKPQDDFEKKVNNFETGPWKPLLKTKPYAQTPLETKPESDEAGYKHPYATEITEYKYPEETYKAAEPIAFTPPEASEAVFVDTEEGVVKMLEELKKADIIAVDLEHHDLHTYVGLVSLMQISTRDKDWIVDTLKPWRENLQMLNEVFANPNILKVFHGSTMDMIWLQRDLGLYVVGLFDTYHASRALNFPKKSLKYLLERFAQFDAQKIFQMSDWRIRPLPTELIDYARSDTHYLLYVFDQVRNLLVEASTEDNNLVDYVLEESKKESLQRYERPVYDRERGLGPVGWYGPLSRRSIRFTNEQFSVYRALHEWRDNIARKEDESPGVILSMNSLFNVSNGMPATFSALMALANPVSKAVRDGQQEILEVINKAKEDSKTAPSFWQVMEEIDTILAPAKKYRKTWDKDDTTSNPVDALALQSAQSQLWGSAISSEDDASQLDWQALAIKEALLRIVPIPVVAQITPSIPGIDQTAHISTLASAPSSPAPNPTPKVETPDVFTIKDLKRQEQLKQVQESPSEISIDVDSDGLTRSERKARRKEEKRLKKLAKEASQDSTDNIPVTSQAEQPIQPFDYANAPSILHTKPESQSAESGKKRKSKSDKKRPFDPYAKATEAPPGLKRAKKEIAGKSFTFRN